MTETKAKPRDPNWLRGVVSAERQACIGLGCGSSTLASERQKALEYYKGEMKDVKPKLKNRSSATDSTIADTVEAVMPDLMEIFASEDVIAFDPVDEADIARAETEAGFLRHVVFARNNGWKEFCSATKDALLTKLGVFKFWWERAEKRHLQEGLSPEAVQLFTEAAAREGAKVELVRRNEDGTEDVEVVTEQGGAKILAVPSEDFGFSGDGTEIEGCTYYVMRSDHRAQDLIDMGYEPEQVAKIDRAPGDETDDAREIADEDDTDTGSDPLLRTVTIHEHYIRTDYDGTGLKRWRVVTNADESVVLGEPEEASGYGFATMTPFLQPHHLIGMSMADKTMEPQKIATALLRIMLDQAYFAVNQRVEIAEDRSNEYTLGDWMNNQPGMGVRVKTAGAVTPIQSGALNFDIQGALELVATMAEKRSGVIRNAQGLNPDSLHDTASGQKSMLSMSQKRTRMIARTMCETGLRDLFLGLHRLYREHATGPVTFRKGAKDFQETDPQGWLERDALMVEVGSYSREEAIAAMMQLKTLIAEIVELQGGPNGPIIQLDGIYVAVQRLAKLLPIEGIEDVFSNPEGWEPPPEKPDPEAAAKAKELALKEREQAHKAQMDQETLALERDKAIEEAALKERTREFEAQHARERFAWEKQLSILNLQMKAAEPTMPAQRPGGDLSK